MHSLTKRKGEMQAPKNITRSENDSSGDQGTGMCVTLQTSEIPFYLRPRICRPSFRSEQVIST